MNRTWKEQAYCTFPVYDPTDSYPDPSRRRIMGFAGKIVGMRSDGIKLSASVILPHIWPANFNWVQMAHERLDTMLDEACTCSLFGQCPTHYLLAQQWAATDLARNAIVPETVPEILQGIVTPKKPKIILA